MKIIILNLALVVGLTSLAGADVGFTSSTYPFFFEQITFRNYPISDQFGSYYVAIGLFGVNNAQKNDKVTLYTSIPGQIFLWSDRGDLGWYLDEDMPHYASSSLWVSTENTANIDTFFDQGIAGFYSPIEYTYATYTYADGTSVDVYPTSVLSFGYVRPSPIGTYPVPMPDGTTDTITIPDLTIPEPSALSLLPIGLGLVGLAMLRRRRS